MKKTFGEKSFKILVIFLVKLTVAKKYWQKKTKKYFCEKKVNFLVEIFFGFEKNFWFEKIFGSKNFWVEKKFWVENILC